jgi:hypothetical protein
VSGVCNTSHQCAVPACDDNVQNGSETGVDCGGVCPPCGHLDGSGRPTNDVPQAGDPTFFARSGAGIIVSAGSYGTSGSSAGVSSPVNVNIVWLGSTTDHVFHGSIWVQGTFSNVGTGCPDGLGGDPCSWETDDFDSYSSGATQQGFHFTASANLVYYDLYIEGVADPHLQVFFIDRNSGNPVNPTAGPGGNTFPFGLTFN